jgi:hypothetical protein
MSCRDTPNAGPGSIPTHLVELVTALPPDLRTLVHELPQRLVDVAAIAPVYSARPPGAALLKQHVVEVSPRSLEAWRLPWQHVNGKAVTLTIVLLAVGYAKLSAAPVTMGGRSRAGASDQDVAG